MMGFGLIIFLFFAGLLVAAAMGIGRLLLSNNTSLSNLFNSSAEKTSRKILEERFVRGEINREEFETMKMEID